MKEQKIQVIVILTIYLFYNHILFYHHQATLWLFDVMVACWTGNCEIAGSTSSQGTARGNDLGQVYMHVSVHQAV